MTPLCSIKICASGVGSLSPDGRNDRGETYEQRWLGGYGHFRFENIDQRHLYRRRRDRLNGGRRLNQGSEAAWNPTLQTEVAQRAASDIPPSRFWPPFFMSAEVSA